MTKVRNGSTDRKLLQRIAALSDNLAWHEFYRHYDPRLRRWCSRYDLDSDSVDELCQRVWVELLRRMPNFLYDPGGSFRAWLKRLCHHRAVDYIRERHDRPMQILDSDGIADRRRRANDNADSDSDDENVSPERLALVREGRDVHEAVKRKVKPIRWDVFWRVEIEFETPSEVAKALGLKYATAFAAYKHVKKLLREEGDRRRKSAGLPESSTPGEV